MKAVCIERLANSTIQFGWRPTTAALGDNDKTYGLPSDLLRVVNVTCLFFIRLDGRELAKEVALDIFKSIPVGINLSAVTYLLAYWLLYNKNCGIARHFSLEVRQTLLADMEHLHTLELGGSTIAVEIWRGLQNRVSDYVYKEYSLRPDLKAETYKPGRHPYIVDTFETLANPLTILNPILLLHSIGHLAARDYDAFPYFSEQDELETFSIHNIAFEAKIKREVLVRNGEALCDTLDSQIDRAIQNARTSNPSLWARYDAWVQWERSVARNNNDTIVQFLTQTLRNAAAQ